eukprot:TRINITY_DN31179_c0_g1_i1.p1 TRINITY_DN31179_c0_g1~~TRINITY_DN31179_c0_g1_i1.p1  ORF type:complete len:391 (+),score=60.08 TRINITY_DN31179_c0_g1_i1:69-1241(+)
MRYVKFGSSDMMVSEACVGTMMWGSFNDEAEAFAQLDAAIEKGVNFIDTAEMYPVPGNPEWVNRTEVFIGKWLADRTASGRMDRSKLYIATKVCGDMHIFPEAAHKNFRACKAGREDPLGDRPPAGYDPEKGAGPSQSAEQMMTACRASLTRLGCDYIDLYQLHWPERYVPAFGKVEYKKERERSDDSASPESFDKIVKGLKALFDAQMIKHWGLSNETAFGIMSFCAACDRVGVPRPVSVQNDVSLLNRGFEQETAEVCRHFNIAGLPYGALAGGTLSGKYDGGDGQEPPNKKARHIQYPNFQARYHSEASLAASRKYSALARKNGLKPVQLAIGWMRSRWWNTSIITGSTSVSQLEEYIDAFSVELSADVLDEIDKIHVQCRNPNVME